MLTQSPRETTRTPRAGRRATVCALAATLVAATAGDLFGAPACARTDVPLDTISTVSAAPSPDGHLLVLDFVGQQIVKVHLPDGTWGPVPGAAGRALKSRPLEAIHGFDGGLLVRQASPRNFIELDGRLGIKAGTAYQVTGKPRGDGREVRSVFLFEPAGRSHLVTCSDIYLGSGKEESLANWVTALVRIPLAAPAAFEVLHEFHIHDRTALGCRLALPLIANLGDRSYFLALEDVPRIYEARPGAAARPLAAFPARFAVSPTLPTDPAREELPHVYGFIEQATMPVGLFAWEGALYLLTRSPAADRGTDWWLTRIDPAADTLAGTVRLGTRASHLVVVPGDPYWALIEKGPVETGFFDQDITGIVAVPAAELRSWQPGKVICSPTGP